MFDIQGQGDIDLLVNMRY